MNQAQIRAVKDALNGKFTKALSDLNKQGNTVATEAVESARKTIGQTKAAKTAVAEYGKLAKQVNRMLQAAKDAGIDLQSARSDYYRDVEALCDEVRADLADEAQDETRQTARAAIDKQVAQLEDLKQTTYLSLYDTPGTELAQLVASVGAQIAKLSA